MKIPRFRISSVMLLIALIALDIGSARVVLKAGSQFLFLLSMVGLPMANILAGGVLVALLRPRSRHFLRGFEVFGAIALAFFVVMAMRYKSLVAIYLIPPMALYEATTGPPPPIGEVSYLGFCPLATHPVRPVSWAGSIAHMITTPALWPGIERLSSFLLDHINVLGRYEFSLKESVRQGRLRPLRSPDGLDDLAA